MISGGEIGVTIRFLFQRDCQNAQVEDVGACREGLLKKLDGEIEKVCQDTFSEGPLLNECLQRLGEGFWSSPRDLKRKLPEALYPLLDHLPPAMGNLFTWSRTKAAAVKTGSANDTEGKESEEKEKPEPGEDKKRTEHDTPDPDKKGKRKKTDHVLWQGAVASLWEGTPWNPFQKRLALLPDRKWHPVTLTIKIPKADALPYVQKLEWYYRLEPQDEKRYRLDWSLAPKTPDAAVQPSDPHLTFQSEDHLLPENLTFVVEGKWNKGEPKIEAIRLGVGRLSGGP